MALLLVLSGEGVPNNRVPTTNPIVKIVNTIASKINIDLGVRTISDLAPLRAVPRRRPMDGPDPLDIRMIMLVEVSGYEAEDKEASSDGVRPVKKRLHNSWSTRERLKDCVM